MTSAANESQAPETGPYMAPLSLEGPHWDFALRVYGQAKQSFLGLQERHGINVSLLLFELYVQACGLDRENRLEGRAVTSHWHEHVVLPLRKARDSIKSDYGMSADAVALRSDILAAEIQAEKIEQAMLAAHIPHPAVARRAPSASEVLDLLLGASPDQAPHALGAQDEVDAGRIAEAVTSFVLSGESEAR